MRNSSFKIIFAIEFIIVAVAAFAVGLFAHPIIFPPGGSMSAEEMRTKIRQLYEEAWAQGNVDILDSLCAEDYVQHLPPYEDVRGIENLKQFWTFTGTSPNFKEILWR